MATATTTWRLVTNQQITEIIAVTPTTLTAYKFALLREDKPFDEHVQANPTSSFRRFEILDTTVRESPLVWNLDHRQVEGSASIRIAYPLTFNLYGRAGIRDAHQVANEDISKIATALETPSNYVSGQQSCRVSGSLAELGPVFVAELSADFIYYESA